MMILRYAIECPGCQARILLRVSVGADIEQPFVGICGRCQTVIKGKQVIWYEPKPGARLEMESAKLIDPQDGGPFDETISVNPDYPARRTATDLRDEGGSSFVHNQGLLGPASVEAMNRIGRFRQIASEDGAALRRFAGFYLRQDWTRFCEEGKRLFEDSWPEPTNEPQYHDVLPRVFLIAYFPLLVDDWLPRFVKEWNTFLCSDESRAPALRGFAEAVVSNGRVPELQRLVLERFDFVATHISAMLPALPAKLYRSGVEAAVAELRLPRDDFDALKGHYVDCYELAHKVLSIIVGTLNIIERGSPDIFDSAITGALAAKGMNNFKNVATLAAFDEKPNGPKRAFLKSVPVCDDLWNVLLERELRNAVGHYGATHDLRTGMILVDGVAHCSYLEFVVKTIRMTHVLLCLLHVLKMCHMQKLLLASATPPTGNMPVGAKTNHSKQRKKKK